MSDSSKAEFDAKKAAERTHDRITTRSEQLKQMLEEAEQNGDAERAEELRSLIKDYDALEKRYAKLKSK